MTTPTEATAEEILHKHIDKESMDELSVNVWPDMIDAMQEFSAQRLSELKEGANKLEEYEFVYNSYTGEERYFRKEDVIQLIEEVSDE